MECKNKETVDGTVTGIYCIENLINGKKYIGQSKDISQRWKSHLCSLRKNKHSNEKLQNAWNKYGEDNFSFKVLETADYGSLDSLEVYYITMFDSYKHGYNKDTGGCTRKEMSEEARAKISASKKNLSEQAKENMRNSRPTSRKIFQVDLDGKIVREWRSARDASRVLGINQCAIWQCLHHQRYTLYGYIWVFPEEFESLDASKYQCRNTQPKKVIQKNFDGSVVKIWDSISKAVRDSVGSGFDSSSIVKCCMGKIKYHKGFIWSYYEQ